VTSPATSKAVAMRRNAKRFLLMESDVWTVDSVAAN